MNRQAEFFAAVQESKIERWSANSIKLYFAVFIAFCCACANGYDGSLMGAIIAMKPFQNTFHTGLTGEKIAIITSLYSVYVLSRRTNRASPALQDAKQC